MKKTIIFVSPIFLCFLMYSTLTFAEEPSNEKKADESYTAVSVTPFALKKSKNRIVPGTVFQIEVDKDIVKEDDKVWLTLVYMTKNDKKTKHIDIKNISPNKENDNLLIDAALPEFKAIDDIKHQSAWGGILFPYEGDIEACYKNKDGETGCFKLPIQIPSVKWAYFWGVFFITLIFIVIALLRPEPIKRLAGFDERKDKSMEEWKNLSLWRRLFLYPLNLAITPIGTYSISLTQIFVWTFVTIFGLIYVYCLTGSFLEITVQILMLLGIGGGTAIGSQINSVSKTYEVPAKYLNLVERKKIPNLKDLITTGGRPSIFKFQMLIFTLLTSYIVVIEICGKYTFPPIPENLITLMGISSAVYIGNEITQESIWEKIENKIKEIEKYATDNNKPFLKYEDIENLKKEIPQVEELRTILSRIYS